MSTFLPHKVDCMPSVYEDQKIFLHGSQVLETLNEVKRSMIDLKNRPSKHISTEVSRKLLQKPRLLHQNLKRITVYHDTLKKLLVQRCILVLKRECLNYIQQNEKFYDECKMLLLSERQNIKMLPVKWHNMFVNSSNINIGNMNILIEKLRITSNHWRSLISSYQRIITIFHIGFSLQLHQLFYTSNMILTNLHYSFLYWAHCSLNISIHKLCFLDPNSVSSQFLKNVLETCQNFNNSVLEMKKCNINYRHGANSPSFRFCGNILVKEFSCAYLFTHLSYFEAGRAAERILRNLISEAQKNIKSVPKNLFAIMWLSDMSTDFELSRYHNTSDYCSASVSDSETNTCEDTCNSWKIKVQPIESACSGLAFVFGSLLQKNQALVLKYLFAVKCLNGEETNKMINVSEENSRPSIAARKVWNQTLHGYCDTSCTHLEKIYWTNFWDKTQNIILKLLIEGLPHQYGGTLPGSIIIWSKNLLATVVKTLKENITNIDISTEGQNVMKQIYLGVYAYAAQTSWDKRLSLALTATISPHCFAVPMVKDEVGTNAGNSFCIAFEPLIAILSVNMPVTNFTHELKVLHNLQSLLYVFFNWIIVKKRAFLSSGNIPAFLIVGYFDMMHAQKTLTFMNLPKHELFTSKKLPIALFSSLERIWKSILNIMNELENFSTEVHTEMYKRAYAVGSDFLHSSVPTMCLCRSSALNELEANNAMQKIVCIMLEPIFETLKYAQNRTSMIAGVLAAIAQAYLDFLKRKNSRFRIQVVKKDVKQLLEWIEQLPIDADDKQNLKAVNPVKLLVYTVKVISLSNCKRRFFHITRNEIAPLPFQDTDEVL